MITVQNGKGSRPRIGNISAYRRNFDKIDFAQMVTCPHCSHVMKTRVPYPYCGICHKPIFPMPGKRRASFRNFDYKHHTGDDA